MSNAGSHSTEGALQHRGATAQGRNATSSPERPKNIRPNVSENKRPEGIETLEPTELQIIIPLLIPSCHRVPDLTFFPRAKFMLSHADWMVLLSKFM